MDDGTIVHINKTTISDTDEDGNSFFFHRAVIHNIGDTEKAVNENQNKDNYGLEKTTKAETSALDPSRFDSSNYKIISSTIANIVDT